jgi:hypothetical protein
LLILKSIFPSSQIDLAGTKLGNVHAYLVAWNANRGVMQFVDNYLAADDSEVADLAGAVVAVSTAVVGIYRPTPTLPGVQVYTRPLDYA